MTDAADAADAADADADALTDDMTDTLDAEGDDAALLSALLGPDFVGDGAGATGEKHEMEDFEEECVREPYRCVRRTLVREDYESFSPIVGALEPGESVTVVRRRRSKLPPAGGAAERLRCCRDHDGLDGWVSTAGLSGDPFVVPAAAVAEDRGGAPAPGHVGEGSRGVTGQSPASEPITPQRQLQGNQSDAAVGSTGPRTEGGSTPGATTSLPAHCLVSAIPFPRKNWLGWGNTSDATISERQSLLQPWLDTLLHSLRGDVDLMEFLQFTGSSSSTSTADSAADDDGHFSPGAGEQGRGDTPSVGGGQPEVGAVERVVWGPPEVRGVAGEGGLAVSVAASPLSSRRFVVYCLDCFGSGGEHWEVQKRFSDFVVLRDVLLAKEVAAGRTQPATPNSEGAEPGGAAEAKVGGEEEAAADAEDRSMGVGFERIEMVGVAVRSEAAGLRGKQSKYALFEVKVYPKKPSPPPSPHSSPSEPPPQQVDEPSWVVRRRFNDFIRVHEALLAADHKRFSAITFPSHGRGWAGGWLGANETAPKCMSERRKGLQQWLTDLLPIPTAQHALIDFLRKEESTSPEKVGDTTEAAASDSAQMESGSQTEKHEGTGALAEPTVTTSSEATDSSSLPVVRKVKVRAVPECRKEDTVYTLTVEPKDTADVQPWTIIRKYSEFGMLRGKMSGAAAALSFPVARVYSRIRDTFDDTVAGQREEALETWLVNVLGLRADFPALLSFLAPSDPEKSGADATGNNTGESFALTSALSSFIASVGSKLPGSPATKDKGPEPPADLSPSSSFQLSHEKTVLAQAVASGQWV